MEEIKFLNLALRDELENTADQCYYAREVLRSYLLEKDDVSAEEVRADLKMCISHLEECKSQIERFLTSV